MELGFFPAFFDHPDRIRFSQQEENEEIELFLRRHFITNVPWMLISFVLLILPFGVVFADLAWNLGLTGNLPASIGTGLILIWYMLLFAYIIENFLFWYFNIYIVTNFNVVDINYNSLLSRSVVEIQLKDIESQKSSIRGIFRELFNFGDVQIETAAENQQTVFDDVPKPDLVADRIQDLRQIIDDRGGP